MTTMTPPELARGPVPDFPVEAVFWATIAPLTSPRPLPRPDNPVALAIWDEITGPYVSVVAVAATYPEWNVIHRQDGTISFGPTIIGGSGGGTITVIETPGAIISDPKPAPDIAPIPLPAAGLLLAGALLMIPILKRRLT